MTETLIPEWLFVLGAAVVLVVGLAIVIFILQGLVKVALVIALMLVLAVGGYIGAFAVLTTTLPVGGPVAIRVFPNDAVMSAFAPLRVLDKVVFPGRNVEWTTR